MLKRFSMKRIVVSSAALFTVLLVCLIPKSSDNDISKNLKQDLAYTNEDIVMQTVFLMDSYNYLAKTKVVAKESDITKKAKELLEILINGGIGESSVPSGFKSFLPSETKVLSLEIDDSLIKVNFSKELLDTKKEYEEKMVEAIVYTLTSIEGIDKVIIYVDNEILSKLPQTGIYLPSTLDRSFGINKEYELTSTNDICKVTVYYISDYNGNDYYVPVTKYINDEREKINIIVDELTSSNVYAPNLKSYLNGNTKLLKTEQTLDSLDLNFNSYIFNNYEKNEILEEVIYTIGLSIGANYDIEEVNILVDDTEITKSVIKTLE